jgi:hypothetical protein
MGSRSYAPPPMTSWWHRQGIHSSIDSWVWPNCSRNFLEGFFLAPADFAAINDAIMLLHRAVDLDFDVLALKADRHCSTSLLQSTTSTGALGRTIAENGRALCHNHHIAPWAFFSG